MNNKVTCTNDSNKPNDISISHWVKKGEEYTPINVITSKLTRDVYFVFEEIKPDNPLYGGYNVNRFSIPVDLILEGIENNELIL
jgi:hypothetical protein